MAENAKLLSLLCVLLAGPPSAVRAGQERSRRDPGRRLPEGVSVFADIPYASTDNPRQKLDLLLPEKRRTDAPLPVIAFVHGGAWLQGDKRSAHGRLARYVRGGEFAGVSIGYRLSPEAIWPAQIHDVKAAIRWIRAHAEEHGLDSERIAAWGASAGGHLVAMLGVSSGVAEHEGELGPHTDRKSSVRCVVDYFGPTDFLKMNDFPGRMDHDAAGSPESRLVGGPIRENREAVRAANPLTWVTGDDAAFLIVHGSKDPLVPFNQSEILHRALEKAGVDSTLIRVEGGGHGFRNAEVEKRARAFLEKHLLGRDVHLADETIEESGPRPGEPRRRDPRPGDRSGRGPTLRVFAGEPRLIVVNGYSTSFRWPALLQRKLDRYFEGRRVVEVKRATAGGTPIARWIDVESGRRKRVWDEKVRPAIEARGERPVIVLGQQSLQWAFGERTEGIRGVDDRERIQRGADVLERYVRRLIADGADLVILAMHIYKKPMEPVIGNERLALAELAKRGLPKFHAGPDVWTPTRDHYPKAFAKDKVHPNAIGAEIMAQLWFETLLEREGLAVPEWSRREMEGAIESAPGTARE